MKILFIVTGLGVGGAEVALLNLISGLYKKHQIEVLALAKAADSPIIAKICRFGVPVHEMNFKSWSFCLELLKFTNIVRKFKPDIIQGWMYHGNIFGYIARLFSKRAKLFLGIRQSLKIWSVEKLTTKIVIWLDALLSRFADGIIYNSHSGLQDHTSFGYFKKTGLVIQNGVDTKKFNINQTAKLDLCSELGISPTSKLIGLIARFHPVKNHQLFIEAASALCRLRNDVKFIMVGTEVEYQNSILNTMIAKHDELSDHMYLLGQRNNIEKITAALDVLVNCSRSEGMSNAIMEALACGVPCVATNVGETNAIVDQSLLVDLSNTKPVSMAKLINKALVLGDDPEYRATLRNRALANFSISKMCNLYEKLYTQHN